MGAKKYGSWLPIDEVGARNQDSWLPMHVLGAHVMIIGSQYMSNAAGTMTLAKVLSFY